MILKSIAQQAAAAAPRVRAVTAAVLGVGFIAASIAAIQYEEHVAPAVQRRAAQLSAAAAPHAYRLVAAWRQFESRQRA